ncbi:hypothetical protein M427DRAFT_51923, partial [Gonapodya prolifera JEL478]
MLGHDSPSTTSLPLNLPDLALYTHLGIDFDTFVPPVLDDSSHPPPPWDLQTRHLLWRAQIARFEDARRANWAQFRQAWPLIPRWTPEEGTIPPHPSLARHACFALPQTTDAPFDFAAESLKFDVTPYLSFGIDFDARPPAHPKPGQYAHDHIPPDTFAWIARQPGGTRLLWCMQLVRYERYRRWLLSALGYVAGKPFATTDDPPVEQGWGEYLNSVFEGVTLGAERWVQWVFQDEEAEVAAAVAGRKRVDS